VVACVLRRVEHFGRAHEHFFGIAPAQRAESADRRRIDQRDFFSGSSDAFARREAGIAAAQRDEIIVFHAASRDERPLPDCESRPGAIPV
jgi:hypothetical protein